MYHCSGPPPPPPPAAVDSTRTVAALARPTTYLDAPGKAHATPTAPTVLPASTNCIRREGVAREYAAAVEAMRRMA
jgi:hypothetical protein